MYSDQNIVSALGGFTYGTNVIEMAGAYRSFAVGGTHVDPTCITSMLYDGKELWTDEKETEVYTTKASQEIDPAAGGRGTVRYRPQIRTECSGAESRKDGNDQR